MEAYINREGVLTIIPRDTQEEFALDCWIEKNLFKEDNVVFTPHASNCVGTNCIGIRSKKLKFEFPPENSEFLSKNLGFLQVLDK